LAPGKITATVARDTLIIHEQAGAGERMPDRDVGDRQRSGFGDRKVRGCFKEFFP
jgi:hypothetical protein